MNCSGEPEYVSAVIFCCLLSIVALMEAVLLVVLYLSYRKIKLRMSGVQDTTSKLSFRLPHWMNFRRFTLPGWLPRMRRGRERGRSPTANNYKIPTDLIAARRPNMSSAADDERAYSKLVHNASNNDGEQEAQVVSFDTVAGYEEPLQSSSGDATHTPHAEPYACSTLPKVRPETAAVPIAKPREHRSFSTGKHQMEVPHITVSLQEEHTYTQINKKKPPQRPCSTVAKVNNPHPPSLAVKPTQLLQPQNVTRRGKFSRRKSNPPPVINKPVPIFATYSTAQEPESEDVPQRALSGSRPPIKPKPKGCIISSYSLAVSGSPVSGGECEYDVAISSVVPPKDDTQQEYDFPLPPTS